MRKVEELECFCKRRKRLSRFESVVATQVIDTPFGLAFW